MNFISASNNIYNKILSFMATFQDIKATAIKDSSIESPIKKNELPQLNLEENKYLLALVARSDFKGQEVQIVYNIVFKLQEIIKNSNT
jgi:hypothetical protein